MLLQVGVNLANDYFDFKNGIDACDRKGPLRVTQGGSIPPRMVRSAMGLCFVAAIGVGSYPMSGEGLSQTLAKTAKSGLMFCLLFFLGLFLA